MDKLISLRLFNKIITIGKRHLFRKSVKGGYSYPASNFFQIREQIDGNVHEFDKYEVGALG
jgi:hypothetical protein